MRCVNAILLAATLTLCSPAQAVSAVRGEVVDEVGAKIGRATIRVLDRNTRKTVIAVRSDQAGHFEIQDLAPGSYLLAIDSSGFSARLIDIGTLPSNTNPFRSIRLYALDCDAPKVNCDTFSERPIEDPHPVVAHGQLDVSGSEAVDLDKGISAASASETADIGLSEEDGAVYLVVLNKARLSKSCGNGFSQESAQMKNSSLRIDGLGPGGAFCIRTNRGRDSKVYLSNEVKPGDKEISIDFVTRAR
jgi:hypothetical protein